MTSSDDILLFYSEFATTHLPTMNNKELIAYDRLINGEHMEWDIYYYMTGMYRYNYKRGHAFTIGH